jgi:hypothetical protein
MFLEKPLASLGMRHARYIQQASQASLIMHGSYPVLPHKNAAAAELVIRKKKLFWKYNSTTVNDVCDRSQPSQSQSSPRGVVEGGQLEINP